MLTNFDPKMSSLGLLDAKLTIKKGLRATIGMVVNFVVAVVVQRLLVVVVAVMVGMLAVMVEFQEIMMTSPPELHNPCPPTPIKLFLKLGSAVWCQCN